MKSFPSFEQWNRRPTECSALPAISTRLGLAGLILATAALMPACSGNGANGANGGNAAAPPFIPAAPVSVARATLKTVPMEVRVIGNGEAYSTVTVRAQIDGRLERAYFTEGQDVNAGDLLFTIDPRPYQARLQQAQANLARDEAQAKNAQSQVERYTQLYQSGIVSKDQYEQFHTNAEALAAAVRADQAAVEDAQILLGYCTIRAPIGGRTGNLMVHPGNAIKANGDNPSGEQIKAGLEKVSDFKTGVSDPITYSPEYHAGLKSAPLYQVEDASRIDDAFDMVANGLQFLVGRLRHVCRRGPDR